MPAAAPCSPACTITTCTCGRWPPPVRRSTSARGRCAIGPVSSSALRAAAARTTPDSWVRAFGYHESVAGPLDAAALDTIVGERLVRVQHRSGALWMLSSAAVRATGAAETDGRLWRRDAWLRDRTPAIPLDLAAVGSCAAALGITGFTDADPLRTGADLELLGRLPQRVVAMGPVGLRPVSASPVEVGPVKVLLDDDALPALDELAALTTAAHGEGRAVAFHCVTRAQIVLAVTTLAGSRTGRARPSRARRHHPVRPLHRSASPGHHGRDPAVVRRGAGRRVPA